MKFLIVVQLQDYVIDSNMINDWFGKPKPLSCKMRVRVREGESRIKPPRLSRVALMLQQQSPLIRNLILPTVTTLTKLT